MEDWERFLQVLTTKHVKVGGFVKTIDIQLSAVVDSVNNLCNRRGQEKNAQIASLLRAVTCLDLTTLCGDDTESNVSRLCHKAQNPIDEGLLKQIGMDPEDIHVGAVCVYPSRILDCVKYFNNSSGPTIPIAAVAAGFPSGQYHVDTKLEEISHCIEDGASEIDIVISRELVLQGEWEELFEQVKIMKETCGQNVKLKTIIAVGELESYMNVFKACIVCMAAGSDFMKTSTGKEIVNATLPIGMVMTRAIQHFYNETGLVVGFKPAGGIRTSKDVLLWQELMKKELGNKWLYPDYFRIGASSLLFDIEQTLFQLVNGCCKPNFAFPYL